MPIKDLRQDTIRPLPYFGANNAQCIYWDRQLPGFGVRVFPSGRRMFVCSYRVQGRKRLATLGRGDVLRLDVARKKAVSYLGQVAEGLDPQAPKETIKAAGTVKSLAETYIRRHAKLKKSTWVEDESYLARHLIPRFGTRLAMAITTDDMAALHAEIGRKHPYAANRLLEVVRKMYNLGRKWGLVPHDKANPASGVERFPETKRRRFVTPDELPQLSKAIDQEVDEYVRHAVWLLLLTGLRRGELLNAKWSDIDWKQRTLSIPKTKNGEALLAPLSHAAISRLKAVPRLQDNPYIICGRKAGQHLVNLKEAWGRIRTAAGLNDLRIHDLRRTVGSWLVRDGASLHLVGSVLNHKDQKTTAGYAYFQTKERHKSARQTWQERCRVRIPRDSELREHRGTGYPCPRQIPRPVAGRFAPLREKRCISSSGRSPLEPYRSDLAYRMSVLPKHVGARIFPLPIEGTGREWPPGKSAKRHACRR